ncbi:MAG: peptide ABC transporter substrate-binding protein, partial [Gammaproteobacteria bacterium]
QWISPSKPSSVINNTLKYADLDPKLRTRMQYLWNQPVLWPLFILALLLILGLIPVFWQYWRKENSS